MTSALPIPIEPPDYGPTAPQMPHQARELPKIPPPEVKTVQQVLGTFPFYARTVNPTMLVELNCITSEQANST